MQLGIVALLICDDILGNISDSSDEELEIPERGPMLSCQETLKEVKKIFASSSAIEDEKIRNLFDELKDCLEKKVVKEKLVNSKQTTIYSFFQTK